MSDFEDLMSMASDAHLHVHGDSVSFVHAQTGVTETVSVIFEEYVGATDELRYGIAHARVDDFSSSPERGDYFTIGGVRWTLLKANDAKDAWVTFNPSAPLEIT